MYSYCNNHNNNDNTNTSNNTKNNDDNNDNNNNNNDDNDTNMNTCLIRSYTVLMLVRLDTHGTPHNTTNQMTQIVTIIKRRGKLSGAYHSFHVVANYCIF